MACARSGTMGWRAPLFALVLLHLQMTGLRAAEQSAEAPPVQRIQPTRESIYQHLAAELQAAEGAQEHVRSSYVAVAEAMRASVTASVVPSLQALVDGVLERAEDTWVAADDAGRSVAVRPCVDGAEADAQQVAKRALEKIKGCVETVEDEGQRRVREAERLLTQIEDLSKRFVTALETCIKEEEAKEATAAPVDPDAGVAVATEAPGQEAADDKKPEGSETDAVKESSAAGQETAAKQKCSKCKKTTDSAAHKEKTSGQDTTQEETNQAEDTGDIPGVEVKDDKYNKEHKSKKGKEYKGKGKSSKSKQDFTNVDETVEEEVSEKSKDKGKNRKGKDGEADYKTTKDGERAEKKSGDAEFSESTNTEEYTPDIKYKKGKKSKKEKGGDGSSEGKKVRKKRDLLAVNESDDAVDSAASSTSSSSSSGTVDPWPTEGSTPEERLVIACLRSLTMQPLLEEKTRAYQRLQAVLQRTAARRQDAPVCVSDHVRKAELKISAIKQRMTSCADRLMRPEL